MRTVLSRIHLFNDTFLDIEHYIYIEQKRGEEDKIAERQRERVCERQSMVEGRGSVSCKTDR
jgi:hypothetical protein